eukprot:704591_1
MRFCGGHKELSLIGIPINNYSVPAKFNIFVNIIMGAVILCVFISFCLLCVMKRSELTTKHSLYWEKKKKKQRQAQQHHDTNEANDETQCILEEAEESGRNCCEKEGEGRNDIRIEMNKSYE